MTAVGTRFHERSVQASRALVAAPVTAVTRPAAGLPDYLGQIVRPSARMNWLNLSARNYTPDYIEMVLRNGFYGDINLQWQLFHWMEDTWPRLSKNTGEVKNAVASMDRTVVPFVRQAGQKPTASAIAKAELVTDALAAMRPEIGADESALGGTIFDLLDGWFKGMSVLEVDWQTVPGDRGPVVAPRCTRWIHPTAYGFSGSAGRLGLRAAPGTTDLPADAVQIEGDLYKFPADKFLVGLKRARSTSLTAGPMLRPLAFWWAVSNFSSQWLLNLGQIFGQPIRWATYDPNSVGLKPLVEAMLENMGSSAWAAVPTGVTLELKEAITNAAENPQAHLHDLADITCDILLLGQTLTTQQGKSGSRALGQVHKSVRDEVVSAAGAWTDTVLNDQLIPAIVRLNFGEDSECPQMRSALREEQDALVVAQRDQVFLAAGVPLDAEEFYKRHDLTRPEPGNELVLMPTAAAAGALPKPGSTGAETTPKPEQPTAAKSTHGAERGTRSGDVEATLDEIVTRATADAAGVRVRWLAPVHRELEALIAAAQSDKVSDTELLALAEAVKQRIPGTTLNTAVLRDHLEQVNGAAALVAAQQHARALTRAT